MKSENFGKNLDAVLKFIDMNQTELANRSGLTQTAISQIINGSREPQLSTICKILGVIPVSFERLVK